MCAHTLTRAVTPQRGSVSFLAVMVRDMPTVTVFLSSDFDVDREAVGKLVERALSPS